MLLFVLTNNLYIYMGIYTSQRKTDRQTDRRAEFANFVSAIWQVVRGPRVRHCCGSYL